MSLFTNSSRVLTRRVMASSRLRPSHVAVGPSLSMERSFHVTRCVQNDPLQKTVLESFHLQHKAKMVPFAGFSMPLSYGDVGQVAAHNHVRSHAGIFDVSHMVQQIFSGPSVLQFLSYLCPSSLSTLPPYTSTLSVLLNEQGGIIDDMMVTKHDDDEFYVVTNAGRAKEDAAWLESKLAEWNSTDGKGQGKEVKWERFNGWGLIALQGPEAQQVLQKYTSQDLSQMFFGQAAYVDVDGVKCHVCRGGYTGEDGFEISIPPEHAVAITEKLAATEPVQLIGLGARDSLRLEAGMCLYGNDLDESTSPIEAGLAWLVGKDRRQAADFIGASRVLQELKDGPKRRRVGLEIMGAPARAGAEIVAIDGETPVGIVTSGIPSPTLGTNIAMGYVASGHHKKGTQLKVKVRKSLRDAVVRPMPFVPARYYRSSKA